MRRRLQAMIFNPDIQFIKTMKKLITFAVSIAALVLSSCKYNDNEIWNSVHGLEDRVAKLEELCKQINTNISSLQTIVTALQGNDYVTGVTPVMQSGKEIGYTITFSKSSPITIFHGKDGENAAPVIGVKKDTDGIYYWTLNGEWLTDTAGSKIKAEGTDGKDGADGEDGENGTTPQFKIENDYWFISYDNGDTWKQLGKATGDDGKDGVGGDTVFAGVDYKTSGDYVIFTLADGTQIKLPTWSAFEALQRLCNQTNTNLSALQTIVTALQNNDWITGVDPLTENGKIVGYTIKFVKSNPIVIYNGKDGADGMDGNTPVIGVKEDEDGIYYWTLNGEFIVVDGQKVQAQGTNGGNGSDGKDGVTPQLKIENEYWFISYDNGATWTQLDKATGEDGKDGADGKDGEGITVSQDEGNVYFTLPDGTVITISKTGQSVDPNIIQFEDENVKKLCVAIWDMDGDHELSYVEAAAVTTIATVFMNNTEIQLFNELKYFTGLTELETNAFKGCSNLWRITIPNNIVAIGSSIFSGCNQLKRVVFERDSKLKGLPSGIFSGLKLLGIIDIPNSIETIGDYAFYGCIGLTDVTFAETSQLKTIGQGAFSDCTNLRSIKIPANVEVIGKKAFARCTSLTDIKFEQGSKLKIIEGNGTWAESTETELGVFYNCSSLISITIPASVQVIETIAFYGCTALQTVTFEENSMLTTIGGTKSSTGNYYGAFGRCTNLTNFDASNCTKMRTIYRNAFYNSYYLSFKINCEIPPMVYFDAFFTYANYGNKVRIYVPIQYLETYKTDENWSWYESNIVGYDFNERSNE